MGLGNLRDIQSGRAGAAVDDESGFTLIELLIAMSVFVVVMIMVFASMNTLVDSEQHVASMSQTSSQVDNAFQQIESEVRYAADINAPGADTSGNYWIEWEADWTIPSQGSPTCTQLEYEPSAGILRQRTWLETQTQTDPPSTGDAWLTLASNLTGSSDPFSLTLSAPDLVNPSTPSVTAPASDSQSSITPEQLSVKLVDAVRSGAQGATTQSSFTVTAVDVTTSSEANTGSVCGGTP